VSVEPTVCANPRWAAHSDAIKAFLEKVRTGEDLTPHLSITPHTKGYAPAAPAQNAPPADRWCVAAPNFDPFGFQH
jgi:hypothetical protein